MGWLNGKAIADELLAQAAAKVAEAGFSVGLAVVLVGENPASRVYVRNKIAACAKTGVRSVAHELPVDTSESALLEKIAKLNGDGDVHGILVQLPLPPHIDAEKVLEAIAPEKDVDGFHALQMGRLVADLPALQPCTPAGCMRLLTAAGVALRGANAVVLGRSHIVGKPMALMLINAGATVTVCNSQTRDVGAVCRGADVLVAAVGRAGFVTGDMVRRGAVVIDVGINRLADGKIVGDVDGEAALAAGAAAVTPVPGGVGPMTIAMLVANTLQAAGVGLA